MCHLIMQIYWHVQSIIVYLVIKDTANIGLLCVNIKRVQWLIFRNMFNSLQWFGNSKWCQTYSNILWNLIFLQIFIALSCAQCPAAISFFGGCIIACIYVTQLLCSIVPNLIYALINWSVMLLQYMICIYVTQLLCNVVPNLIHALINWSVMLLQYMICSDVDSKILCR